MNGNRFTQQDLDKLRRNSRRLRIAAVTIAAAIIVCMYILFRHEQTVKEQAQQEEFARIEAENQKRMAEQAERDSIQAIENQRLRQIADSIRIANMPTYSLGDVREMVAARVPSYSWIYLWRKDNDNWIMKYKREYGGKEHWFMQRFNPTTQKFEKAIEYSTVYYRNAEDRGVYSHPKNVRCSFTEDNVWGTLDYTEDGMKFGRYSRDGIESICRIPSSTVSPLAKQRIRELESAPPAWAEDGYESEEDYYYDNAEDLYFYYGR